MSINTVLKTNNDVLESIKSLKSLGLLPHPHRIKSWDTCKIIQFIQTHGITNSVILDVGCNGSPILPYLKILNFTNLYGCDLTLKSRKPIFILKLVNLFKIKNLEPLLELFENKDHFYHLSTQNIENVSYDNNHFDFISSLSVIEHGVNMDKFFSEMYRILKKGGCLLLSTDYWPNKIETESSVYNTDGLDVIFDKKGIERMVSVAENIGFNLCEPIDFTYQDKVVHWKKTGKNYTFIFLCFQK